MGSCEAMPFAVIVFVDLIAGETMIKCSCPSVKVKTH